MKKQFLEELKRHEVYEDDMPESELSFWYCFYFKDRKEVRKNITESYWACAYCLHIKNRPEVRKYMKGYKLF